MTIFILRCIIRFPLRFASGTLGNSIFLYLTVPSYYLNFFLASRFSAKSVGKLWIKSVKYHKNTVYHKCFEQSILTFNRSFLLTYQFICLRICCLLMNSFVYVFVAYVLRIWLHRNFKFVSFFHSIFAFCAKSYYCLALGMRQILQ